MPGYRTLASITALAACTWFIMDPGATALDMEKAHVTAIQNCVNWNGSEAAEYCTCVQDKVRADLPGDSYMAMMQFAEAYRENRRADMAAMQVDAEMSKALEPVDAVVSAAEATCKSS